MTLATKITIARIVLIVPTVVFYIVGMLAYKLYLPFLIPLGIGLLLGIILTTKLLEQVMTKYPQPTYLVILGFMLGSMTEVYPGLPSGWEILLCIGTMAAGFFAIYFLSRNEKTSAEA